MEQLFNHVVISMKNAVDRRSVITPMLNQQGISPIFFEGFTPPQNMSPTCQKYLFHRGLGAVGCLLSHVGVLKIAKAMNWENVVIWEDDAVIIENSNINEILSKILSYGMNYDIINLSWDDNMAIFKSRPMNSEVQGIFESYWSTCYMVPKSSYDKILEEFSRYEYPVDVALFCSNRFLTLAPMNRPVKQSGTISQIGN